MPGVGPSFNYGQNYNLNNSASPLSSFGNPGSFTAGAQTQAGDYDTIMKNYSNLVKGATQSPITPQTITPQSVQQPQNVNPQQISQPGQVNTSQSQVTNPNVNAQTAQYNQSADVTGSLADLSNLAQTGGYSAQNIADIRARDISPIRSIYANAQQNVNRSRALGGGYSPNYNATVAQMSRDAANQIADTTTSANAGIAQNVAANKLAASGSYAGAAAGANAETEAANLANANIVNATNQANANRGVGVGEFNAQQNLGAQQFNIGEQQQTNAQNANIVNQINEANANRNLDVNTQNVNRNMQGQEINSSQGLQAAEGNRAAAQSATGGMANLYGTTPALTNTFGNQVMQATYAGQNQQQINEQRQRDLFGFANQ